MPRHFTTIHDLSNDEIEAVFRRADRYLEALGTSTNGHRLTGRVADADGRILATIFFEPSTRTRLSFESAMTRLGGSCVSSADAASSSASKGESIADTVRVIESYADVLVIRSPWEGAARVAADFAGVPVINAGDGGHEHPTQTLCDLYTLRREHKTLANASVLLCGDLKHGRTIHSLIYALARFGATIIPLAADGLGLPQHVRRRLREEFDVHGVPVDSDGDVPVDVVYQQPDRDHQLSLVPDVGDAAKPALKNYLEQVDVCYVTRSQKERQDGDTGGRYPRIDKEFLGRDAFRDSRIMHPLPRVTELGYDLDADARAVYFKQAAYGVPVRMALLAALLDEGFGNARPHADASVDPGRYACTNNRCVTNADSERGHIRQRFDLAGRDFPLLRCGYCEHELRPAIVALRGSQSIDANLENWRDADRSDLIFFESLEDAARAGYRAVGT
ncbi:MAG: hypothetical protein AAGD32_13225 [Planctomycetota bacterium]